MSARVVHCKREPFDIYIGRPSKWGNPFTHIKGLPGISTKTGTLAVYEVESRDAAVEAYEEWIQTQPDLLAALPQLKGMVLGCWCAPQRCHGDVLVRLANG